MFLDRIRTKIGLRPAYPPSEKKIMLVVNPGYKFMFILHCHIQTHEMLRLEHGSVTFQPLLDDNYDSPTDQPANRLIALLPGCSSRR